MLSLEVERVASKKERRSDNPVKRQPFACSAETYNWERTGLTCNAESKWINLGTKCLEWTEWKLYASLLCLVVT